jgi:hypothetical protein
VYLKLATDGESGRAGPPGGGVAMSAHDIVYRFLDTQSIGRKSRYCYVSVLRDFDAFVLKRAPATGRLRSRRCVPGSSTKSGDHR